MGIDEKKVVPNESLSVFENAVSCWKGEKEVDGKIALFQMHRNIISQFTDPTLS